MTAVVQTEDFAKLDESIMRTFIVKAAQVGIFKTQFEVFITQRKQLYK